MFISILISVIVSLRLYDDQMNGAECNSLNKSRYILKSENKLSLCIIYCLRKKTKNNPHGVDRFWVIKVDLEYPSLFDV